MRSNQTPQSNLRQRGQMSILITLVFLTLFLLFAFVMNAGVLINEKINLQNTADLAAYAGASIQARLLNKIGYINFRIRQNWKEFTFHNWVTHMRSAKNHPVSLDRLPVGTNIGPMDVDYLGGGGSVLSCICLPGTNFEGITSNFCQEGCEMSFPGVAKATPLFDSPLTSAFARVTEEIRAEVYAEWAKWQNVSKDYAIEFIDDYAAQNVRFNDVLDRYIAYLNELGRVTDPIAGNDVLSEVVRTTIMKNLSMGNAQSVNALNLLPDDPDTPWYKGNPLETFALVIYAVFGVGADGLTRVIQPSPIPEVRPIRLGMGKQLTNITYYALRLISKPNLIYLPEHWEPVLVSYAAAKPFGSRTGPQLGAQGGSSDRTILLSKQAGQYTSPNFSFYEGDTFGIKARGQMDVLSNYYTGQAERESWPKANNKNWQAIYSIRAPNHYDAMRYPVFVDPKYVTEPKMFARETYPDGIEFLSDQNLFPPDEVSGRSQLFPTDDGDGNDLGHDFITLGLQNDQDGSKTYRATLQQTRSSWATEREAEEGLGRTGYSVKLVNMNQLISIRFQGGQFIENLPTGDVNVENTAPPPGGQVIWY